MIPNLPPPLPQRRVSSGEAEVTREREMQAEIRRLKRQATYRRSTIRVAISLGFDAYLAYGLVVYRSVFSLALLSISIALTAWTVRDTLRARREFASNDL
jgi:hypothetical protein